ncbi:hypothetical protein [Aquimarina algiphila]|uniref:Phage holin family protein n=1 Tax=Aquimarina algiphila TaxID=2047982 RepID=A0A554VE30_9FLAO|nr:hypothetical protein [Aquimarina algiphila]TSE05261.1 hypothetical protein FOF46_23650 [Aquimarina algiphila]
MNTILFIIKKFIYKNLLSIHSGTVLAKVKSTFYLSLITSPFGFLGEKIMEWFSINFVYVLFVMGAIIVDHILGSYIHAFVKRDFSMKENIKGFVLKCLLVIAVGYLIEGFKHILGGGNFITDYFSVISRLMVFVYPAGSALMNCSIITNGKFPPTSWISKITKFNKDMNLDAFKNAKG